MRYLGKANIKFINGVKRVVEHVAIANDIEMANAKCKKEFDYSYLNKARVLEYEIIPCVEYDMPLPTKEFVKEQLQIINDIKAKREERNNAKYSLYYEFQQYQPAWDDDGLSDIISFCDFGRLNELCKEYEGKTYEEALDIIISNLLMELDGEWTCCCN